MDKSQIESDIRIRQVIRLLVLFLGVTQLQNVSAQEEPFSFVILSDPQIWRAHNPRTEDGREICPEDDPRGEIGDNACSLELPDKEEITLDRILELPPPFEDVNFDCTYDFVFRPETICNALAAHDAVVETINEVIGWGESSWPADMLCPPGANDSAGGCISEGQDNQLVPPSGVIINGDLTENGTLMEYQVFGNLYSAGLNPFFWPGLGNHDYQNNFGRNDKGKKNARTAVERMAIAISSLPLLFNLPPLNFFDFELILPVIPQLANYDLIGEAAISNRTFTRKGFRVRARGITTPIMTVRALRTAYFPLGYEKSRARQPW